MLKVFIAPSHKYVKLARLSFAVSAKISSQKGIFVLGDSDSGKGHGVRSARASERQDR